MDEQFAIRRFRLLNGEDLTLYCQLVAVRAGVAGTYRLYEDARGLRWVEIAINAESHLVPLTAESFEQQVAQELLTLGFNKYSG